MRIGIDATICFSDKPTGLGIYTINMVNELAKLHDDIVVWTISDSRFNVGGGKLRRVMPFLRRGAERFFLLRPLWLETMLPAELRKEGVDVLFSTVPSALTSAPVPHVVTVHDLIPLSFPGESPWSVCWNYRNRIPKILERASAIITDSDYTRKDLERYSLADVGKIQTVYAGYDREHFYPLLDNDVLRRHGLAHRDYFLYVGNASKRKNLEFLIRAFASIADRLPQKLVLCGSKTARERDSLNKCADECGVVDRVVFIDYAAYRDLPSLYSSAVLFVYPSLYEGFGLPVLEAMACGVPVVAADCTSIPEVAGSAAVLVSPLNSDSFAEAMLEVSRDPLRREEMVRAGLQQCRNFSWKRAAVELLSVVSEVA